MGIFTIKINHTEGTKTMNLSTNRETNNALNGSSFVTFSNEMSFVNWPLSRGYFGPLPLWRGCRCGEVAVGTVLE